MTNAIKLLIISLFLAVGLGALLRPARHAMADLEREVAVDFPDVPQVSTRELADRLSRRDSLLLIDVRTAAEYQISHLPGAEWIGEGSSTRQLIGRFGTNRDAVLYCSAGYRASQVARNLRRAGWTNASVLGGSIFRWAIEKRPLESNGVLTAVVHPFSASYASILPPEARADLPRLEMAANAMPAIEKWRMGLGILLLMVFLTWETLSPAHEWFRGRERFLHGWRNYMLGLLNVVLAGLFFVQLWLFVSRWADAHQFGLLHWAGLPPWARAVVAVLLLDFWTYWWHRLNHRFGFLWRFHRTHHSETNLDISSAVRFHFGEMSISALLRLPLIALLGLRFHELVIYETVLFSIVQFHHANIRLPLGMEAVLSKLIVTPSFHRVHHSPERAMADSNYSSILSLWDRLFKTRSLAPPPKTFGIAGLAPGSHRTVVGMVESPFD